LFGAEDATLIKHLNKNVLGSAGIGWVDLSSSSDLAAMLIRMADATDGRMSGIRETSPIFRGRVPHPDIHSLTTVPGSDPKFIQPRNDHTGSDTKLFGNPLDRHPAIIHLLESPKINGFASGECYPDFSSMSTDDLLRNSETSRHLFYRCPDVMHSTQNSVINDNSSVGGTIGSLKPIVHSRDVNPILLRQLLDIHSGIVQLEKVVDVNIIPFHGYVYDFQTISTLCIGNGVITSNCRSRIIPYFGGIPGERDYTKGFSQEFIDGAEQMEDTFRSKYWKL
jgi:hypothetical protein